ncbi:hypothetical protein C4J99_1326 [Pseudomonas synxantha]|nr:hypothetical protein C4K02_1378 [Pseudomonas synxantha]AZE65706.1 hypothetical protein C4K01_1495 [Pseudomonas synxantha]AZE77127.1 hypothetical protein C4J99_1326 [Pseudomonas synxantha]
MKKNSHANLLQQLIAQSLEKPGLRLSVSRLAPKFTLS